MTEPNPSNPPVPASVSELEAETIARRFHGFYELLAPSFGYTTREESSVDWADVPEVNRRLMIAVVEALIESRVIAPSALLSAQQREIDEARAKYDDLDDRAARAYKQAHARADAAEAERDEAKRIAQSDLDAETKLTHAWMRRAVAAEAELEAYRATAPPPPLAEQSSEQRPHIWIERRGDWLVCGDEHGKFAASFDLDTLMPYIAELIAGPGTLRDGPLPPAGSDDEGDRDNEKEAK